MSWQPSGDEPQSCGAALAKDRSCIGSETYGVWFTLPAWLGQPLARVTMWVYPAAANGPGDTRFTVACRYVQEHGPWHASGWLSVPRIYATPQDATDAALGIAVALACGTFGGIPGGTPGCLLWDGMPW